MAVLGQKNHLCIEATSLDDEMVGRDLIDLSDIAHCIITQPVCQWGSRGFFPRPQPAGAPSPLARIRVTTCTDTAINAVNANSIRNLHGVSRTRPGRAARAPIQPKPMTNSVQAPATIRVITRLIAYQSINPYTAMSVRLRTIIT